MRWLILALALFVTATAHAQVSDSDAAFYRAWYQETALRDFDAAAKAYAALAATPGVPTDLAVKAHLGRARCLMLTGHIDDAQAEYRAAAATDPSNIEAKTALTTPTAAASRDVELMQSINSLLTSASNGDVKS
ncbi:MAG: hypothetical protein HYR85_06485, partial [Planctomycetes bacterium]|nr:hypothetical protein [Planctomycetota bacterium]